MWQQLEDDLAAEFGDLRPPKVLEGFQLTDFTDNPPGVKASYSITTAQKIYELYTSGQSIQNTAKKLGVTYDVVIRLLHKLSVPYEKITGKKLLRPAGCKPKGPDCACGKKGYARGRCKSCYEKDRRKDPSKRIDT